MSSEVKVSVENKNNNSLIRKTKAELIEIIFRKDSVEKQLRADIAAKIKFLDIAEGNFHELKNRMKNLDEIHCELEEDYRLISDNYASIKTELKNTIKSKNILILSLSIIAFISIIMNILRFIF